MTRSDAAPSEGEPIVAIATPVGVGALAVVRMSGSGVFDIADRVFSKAREPERPLAESPGYTAHFGRLYDGDSLVDEVIVLVFRAPNSFTMENMVEITCHGGPVVTKHVLKLLLDNGCRLAEPGEFTRRAFLNGRIDLLQAEAIGEMIHARSESAYRTAVNQMKGSLSGRLSELRDRLLQSRAMLELELDFSEEDVEFQSRDELSEQVDALQREVTELVDSYQHGRLLSEGVATAIIGRPNAGKSTLLNALLGEERAIVSHMPGTTRDYIEECFIYRNTMFRLTDTAGLREAVEEIEHEGIRRSYEKIAGADLILYMIDISEDDVDEEIPTISRISAEYPGTKLLVVANKIDRILEAPERMEAIRSACGCAVLGISALQEDGLAGLREEMNAMTRDLDKLHDASVLVTSMRHYEALRNAQDALQNARELIDAREETELVAFELRSALDYIGEITGRVVNEEVLNMIFDRFCIGK
ncbi:tRNA uridine-5-carboxymethylaminomethyl(34) synthesis GTPase MnmE [Prosthecochloris sp. N3]|uniref:tRNA modification GTPase MnmE n=1 Tax=Prosthecochloris ethylica TaxID=2743976 RepID=A0ABR9XQW4_9CHLB|nr:tRNA uridine-5-carboxymethylaminomethyl(34) synthesis GTPase MnmE [Prosthecochloris ethylica]MBF0586359.1 tRNA uridine-5-carboxymethylaminomethyl(34) synthesis GTPase MnmE [Prosthecochloris ethylica]MBF0636423.1 tRNA uridine-5-carboxymethylaminomethyl(34) synthesis GTPase MnmE [Prosthecochloris ethylica]NUK47597.1 tRNA uridine-5-carboxymethylaminomethyl(34) synthesis GTPase MnmE [Prosthecochloris ethylica]